MAKEIGSKIERARVKDRKSEGGVEKDTENETGGEPRARKKRLRARVIMGKILHRSGCLVSHG